VHAVRLNDDYFRPRYTRATGRLKPPSATGSSAVSPTSEMRALLITRRENGAENLREAGVLGDAYIFRPSVIRKNTSTPAAGYAGLASW
jgi:hypothetical protein